MQDRFRVRGWDGIHNHYEYDLQNMMYECEYHMFSGELDNMTLLDAISKGLVSELIPEQCTGLKDKNGKLIYEGDIVLLSDNNKNYQVFFNEETAQFQVKMPYMSGYEVLNFGIYKPSSSLFTVIGNIHENPDLLEA